jgi:hypothetical protein
MKLYQLSALLACAFMLFMLAACGDDPSGVGVGVNPRGFDGGVPQAVNLEPTTFTAEPIDDVTGNSSRILTGRVDDPVVGEVEATAYIDVSLPATLPDGFTDGTVSAAELVLSPRGSSGNTTISQYIYGDTLSSMTLGIYAMPEEWEATTSDETLSAGSLIAESEPFTPGDTVRISLPDTWSGFSTLNDTTDFAETFHGFQIRALSGGAVVGYAVAGSSTSLRVEVGDDDVQYDATRSFSSIERLTEPSISDRVLVQDGVGRALSVSFTLPDSLTNSPISRAALQLQTDTTLFDPSTIPNGFVRPRTGDLVLQGFTESGGTFLTVPDSLNAQGAFVFSAAALREVFQQAALGETSVDRFRLSLSQASNTINPLLFYRSGTEDNAPHVSLTITQSGN